MYDVLMSVGVVETSFEDELAEVAGHLDVQHARWVEVTARAAADGGWHGEGIHSIEHC